MDLAFTEEEEMLRDAVAQVLDKSCDFARVKEIEETEDGYDPSLWAQLAELGMLGTFFPEAYGGSDLPFMMTAIVMEELGKRAAPTPYHASVITSGLLIMEGGSEDQKQALLPAIAEGELIVAPAIQEADAGFAEASVEATANRSGDGWTISGTKMFVPEANIAGKLIVAARANEGVSLYLVDAGDGVTVAKMPTVSMDNSCEVVLEQAPATLLGEPGGGWSLIESVMPRAAVAKAAEQIGGMKTALAMTVAYSKEREQYGRPIGGYQVLQHYMANMLMACDTADNYLYQVVSKIDAGEDYATDAAALKAYANTRFNFVSERAIQIHGGIGTTRECHIGLFYRRAKAAEYIAGITGDCYDTVAAAII